ncbi:MAG: hypothetical protein OXT67_04750, partial [Zetaproteobacteria bacterium]|nr:hypothetical protein [Zetaproteobacteria bacterium]
MISIDKLALNFLVMINSVLGVDQLPTGEDWKIKTGWTPCGHSLCLEVTNTELIQQCQNSPESFVIFPQVVHAYTKVESIAVSGAKTVLLELNDRKHERTESFYKEPALSCSRVADSAVSLQWSIKSPSHYFARFSYMPYISEARPFSFFPNVTLHMAMGSFLIFIFLLMLIALRSQIFTEPYRTTCFAFFFTSWYFILGSADYFSISMGMLSSHRFADIFLLIGLLNFWKIIYRYAYLSHADYFFLKWNTFASVLIQVLSNSNDGIQLGTSLIFPVKIIVATKFLVLNFKTLRAEPVPFLCVAIFLLSVINDILVVSGLVSLPLTLPIGILGCFYLMILLVWNDVEKELSNVEQLKSLSSELKSANEKLVVRNREVESLQSSLLSRDRMDQMGKLTTSFAHQFNNILNTIKSGLLLLDIESIPQERKLKSRKGIDKAINFGAELVQGIRLTSQNNQEMRELNLHKMVNTAT